MKRFLESLARPTSFDWEMDFIPGRTILEQIEAAAKRSVGGIFLFTKDDDLLDGVPTAVSAPRDNVVFEAGYFIGVKGKRNVLIVRETNSKMPADLGGDIYASLPASGNDADGSGVDRTDRADAEGFRRGDLSSRRAPLKGCRAR